LGICKGYLREGSELAEGFIKEGEAGKGETLKEKRRRRKLACSLLADFRAHFFPDPMADRADIDDSAGIFTAV
jgi:hypothetical protein